MTVDVTTLGIGVDSSGVRKATDDMRGATDASKELASSTAAYEKAMQRAATQGAIVGNIIADVAMEALRGAAAFADLALGVGRYQDMAERTMSDPAGLASFRTAADVAGVSVDVVASSINRMALQLSRSKDEAKGAGKALASIGLDLEQFKRLKPEEQYRAIAVALDGYGDSQEKVAVLQALFGRGGADQLVMMKELAKETDVAVRLTNDQIAAADDLSDRIAKQRSQTKQMVEVMAVGMLPAMDIVITTTREMAAEFLGLNDKTKKLDNTAVTEFAYGVAEAFGFMVDSVRGSSAAVLVVAKTLGAGVAQLKEFFFTGGVTADGRDQAIANIQAIGAAWQEDVGGVLRDFLDGKSMQARINEKIAQARAAVAAARENAPFGGDANDPLNGGTRGGKPKINFTPLKDEVVKVDKAFESLMQRVAGFASEQQHAAEATEKLTAGQRLQLQIEVELAKFAGPAAETRRAAVRAVLEAGMAYERENVAREKAKKLAEEVRQLNQRATEERRKEVEQARSAAEAAELQAANYGRTADAIRAEEIAKLRSAAAQLRLQTNIEAYTPAAEAYNKLLMDQADALDRSARARERLAVAEKSAAADGNGGVMKAVDSYIRDVQNVASSTEESVSRVLRSTEEELTNLVTGGEVKVKRFVQTILNEFLRLRVVRPLMAELLGGGAGGGAGGYLSLLRLFFGADINAQGAGEVFKNSAGAGSLGKASAASGAASGKSGFSQTLTISIDSRTDRAQVGEIVTKAVAQGQREYTQQLKAMGVL